MVDVQKAGAGVRVVSQDEQGCVLGRVRTTAFVDAGPATLPRPFRVMDSYVLAVIHDGAGTYRAPGRPTQIVGPGDAILVAPDQAHWYGPPPGETWTETFIVFDGEVFDSLSRAGVLDAHHGVRPLPASAPWERNVRGFVERTRSGSGEIGRYRQVLELASMLVEICAAEAAAPATSRAIERARARLANDLQVELGLDTVARDVGLTYETFRKQFRTEVGVSPGRFREDCRLEAARTLLRMTTMTHASIASALGFADEQHFSKRFSIRVGTSPRRYRRQQAPEP